MSRRAFDIPDADPPPKPKRKYRRCWECGRRAEHDHHVIPKVLGGKRTVPLCKVCHGKVHDRRVMGSSLLIRAGIAIAKAKGLPHGRKPFGTRPGEAETLKMMRRLYRKPRGGKRLSFGAVAKALNEAARPTRQGGPWQAATVRGILLRKTGR